MLHLAITCRKRTYIIKFGTLDNCKIILTQHICSAECIHTPTTSAYIIILPSWISYLNSSYNMWINISQKLLNYSDTFCVLLTLDFSCKKNYDKPDIQSEGIQFHNIWIIISNSEMAGNSRNHNNAHFAYQLFRV